MKATEHLVDQLKTQIADLERFIQYLQSKQNHLKIKKPCFGIERMNRILLNLCTYFFFC